MKPVAIITFCMLALLYRSYLGHLTNEQEKTLKVNALKSSFPDMVSNDEP